MKIVDIPISLTDWAGLEPSEHPGTQGTAWWRTRQFGEARVRLVEYSPGFIADHWCSKGHFIHCLEGELEIGLEDGRTFLLRAGMSAQVGDNEDAHRVSTPQGAKLYILD